MNEVEEDGGEQKIKKSETVMVQRVPGNLCGLAETGDSNDESTGTNLTGSEGTKETFENTTELL